MIDCLGAVRAPLFCVSRRRWIAQRARPVEPLGPLAVRRHPFRVVRRPSVAVDQPGAIWAPGQWLSAGQAQSCAPPNLASDSICHLNAKNASCLLRTNKQTQSRERVQLVVVALLLLLLLLLLLCCC
jgi:hypothetical protein